MTCRFRPICSLAAVAAALALLSGPADASRDPPDDPSVVQERDTLIDKIARGEDVDASVRRFAALVKERDRVVATSRAAKEAEEKTQRADREFKDAYRKSIDHEAGWRCSLTVDPKNPARDHDGYFRGDWGR